MKSSCFVFLCALFAGGWAARPQPLVVLSSTFRWNAENSILITPTANSYASNVDISVQITGTNSTDSSRPYRLSEEKKRVPAGEPFELKVNVRGKAEVYEVVVSVSGHSEFKTRVRGRPNVESVFLLTDKTFYKPNETINFRSLPLTPDGAIFHSKLKYVLQDPNGFAIRTIVEKASNHFLPLTFDLPLYLRHGNWKIVATSQHSSYPLGEVVFRVQEYVLPKFHVIVDVNDNNQQKNEVEVTVLAKFPRGSKINGDLLLFCSVASDRQNASTPAALPPPRKISLASGKIVDGQWTGKVDIRRCYAESGARIEVIADVHEADTFKTERGSTFYEVLKPGFEVIPARPAVVKGTKKIVLYVRPLSNDSSIKESEVFVNFLCISSDRSHNGFQRNHSGYKLGGFLSLDFDVNPSCVVHIFKIYRKLAESVLSREETIAIPTLPESSPLKLSWIESADPAKVVYHEGDSFEASITTQVSDLNYVVVCNSRSIVANGKVAASNRISVPIRSGMNGVCSLIVFKIEQPSTKLDLMMFMAESRSCPSTYRASVSDTELMVNKEMILRLEAAQGAIGVVRAMDARLAEMLTNADALKRHSVFGLSEFDTTVGKNRHSAILSGFLDKTSFLESVYNLCSLAGAYIPTSNLMKFTPGSSSVSNFCLSRIVAVIVRRSTLHFNGQEGQLNDSESRPNVNLAHLNFFANTRVAVTPAPQNIEERPKIMFEVAAAADGAGDPKVAGTGEKDELFLRDFFPEVWLFDNVEFDHTGVIERKLRAPHSVASWEFAAHLWSAGKRDVCKLPSLNVVTWRHFYVDVDLPPAVYENETVEFHLTVAADKLEQQRELSMCISGFSPLVCGDMGPHGKTEVADYSSILLDPQHMRVRKSFFVRFLREGTYDVQFDLIDRSRVSAFGANCEGDENAVLDKSKHTIHVLKRVDVDEHFRQSVIHRQRRSAAESTTDVTASTRVIHHHRRLVSQPDVIQFAENSMDNGTIVSSVSITSSERVYDVSMEFSEFIPSLPLRDSDRNFVEMKTSTRRRRQVGGPLGGGLSGVVKELASVAFQPTADGLNSDFDLSQRNEVAIGNLLSELLTYSDCQSAAEPSACGFGEWGVPSSPEMRDVVLTSLSTLLLCEKSAADSYICGPVQYLAQVIGNTANTRSSFLDMLQFESGKDTELFLRALLSWVGRECSVYQCVQSHSVWKTFLQREYESEYNSKDLRIEAAFAHLFPHGSSGLIRQRLADNADFTAVPYWNVETRDSTSSGKNALDTAVQQSANVLLNSLAMLAFSSTPALFNFWKQQFDFDLLADWLVEQQNGRKQYQNALDTYFGLKALYAYRNHQLNSNSESNILVNLTAGEQQIRRFDDHDLPLQLSLPPQQNKFEVESFGDMRVVMGVRVLTEKRRRQKRDPSENYPVSIKVTQTRNGTFLTQRVAIMSHAAMLSTLEIEHGIFTQFTIDPDWIRIVTPGIKTVIPPRVGAASFSFVASGLQKDREMIYEARFAEPTDTYTLDGLAPFLITARQHLVVGRLVVFARDLDFSVGNEEEEAFNRRKRFASTLRRLAQTPNLIETVCVENGACTCAEATCEVTCQTCGAVTVNDLCAEFKRPHGFVVVFRLDTHREENLDGATYDVFDISPSDWYGVEALRGKFTIWIRSCNTLCRRLTRDGSKGRYMLIGSSNGIFYSSVDHSNTTDTSSLHRHYLLRNDDRLAKASDCYAIFSEFEDNDCISNKATTTGS